MNLNMVPFSPRVSDDIGLGNVINLSCDVCLNEGAQSLVPVEIGDKRAGKVGEWGQPTGEW